MISKLAVQLYTVREFTKTAKDFARTLERIQAIGYPAVQLSAVGCMAGEQPEVDAALCRRMLDDHGLVCAATHRPFEDLLGNTQAEIEFHLTLGCAYCAIGGLPRAQYHDRGAQGYRDFLRGARPMAADLKTAGIAFGYHNHAHEFIPADRPRKTCYDILIDEGEFMAMELDTYWAVHAGADPVALIKRCPGRLSVIHLKDKEVHPEEGPIIAAIGEGNLNWEAILPAFAAAGTQWYAVEQDRCLRDPFDCLKSSFEFLRAFDI
ncbi:MAG: sugar phosphate isomerase/epimerase [Candidatus Marinimicrobia bacterium]|nr:sugar phosphate isomerase/epimerase [Candidatus Neomarinimicrobiota bacterium]